MDDTIEKKPAAEQKGEVHNDWLQNPQNNRAAFEQALCGYKIGDPIGSDHAMDASATVESPARDKGGEAEEVVTACVHKRLRPSVNAWRAAKSKDMDKGRCASGRQKSLPSAAVASPAEPGATLQKLCGNYLDFLFKNQIGNRSLLLHCKSNMEFFKTCPARALAS